MQNPDDAPNASGSATIAQSNSKVIKIGTRQSILALVQTNHVAKLLRDARPGTQCEVVGVSVLGDRDKKTALYAFNAKALWTSELEESLAAGQLDMVVHCLKGALYLFYLAFECLDLYCPRTVLTLIMNRYADTASQ